MSQVTEYLVAEFLRILDRTGRDWHRVQWAIRGLEAEVRASIAQDDPWSGELVEYLESRVVEALILARAEAIDLEEFEWAHEISTRLVELGAEPKITEQEHVQ